MLPWLFNIFTDGVLHETKARTLSEGISLNFEDKHWETSAPVFANDTVLLHENEHLKKLLSLMPYVSGEN